MQPICDTAEKVDSHRMAVPPYGDTKVKQVRLYIGIN
jgi:hypothetical protein